MSRGHNNPNATERPSPAIDWNAVEWWVYRTRMPKFGHDAYDYRVVPRKLSAGELKRGEELACTVSRCSLAAVRKHLRDGVSAERVQAHVDELADWQTYRQQANDEPHRLRMAERRAQAQAEFEARRKRAEQRLAEDVARLPVAA